MKLYNKYEISLSATFLFAYMAFASWLSFFNLYLKGEGYTSAEIGIIGGTFQAMLIFAVPIWGVVADKYGIKKITSILLFITGLMLYFLQFINSFWLMIFYVLILAVFNQPIGSLIDTLGITYVREARRSSFGELRLWGSIGWALSAYGVGVIIQSYELSIIFPIAATLTIILLLCVLSYNYKSENFIASPIKLKDISKLLKNRNLILFYSFLVIYGISISPINLFINLYYNEIGASVKVLGLAFVIQSISEIPFFFLGLKITDKFGSSKIIILAIIVTIFRMTLYGLNYSPMVAVIVGLTQGITLSLFLVAVVEYGHKLIPDKLRATGQSLIWASHFGIGVTIGNVLIGFLNSFISMNTIMLLCASTNFVILCGAIAYYKISSRNNLN